MTHLKIDSGNLDAVSLGILWDRLISIANETVEVLVRTSFSSIVRENYDLACVLLRVPIDVRMALGKQGQFVLVSLPSNSPFLRLISVSEKMGWRQTPSPNRQEEIGATAVDPASIMQPLPSSVQSQHPRGRGLPRSRLLP